MITEKIEAGVTLQALAFTGGLASRLSVPQLKRWRIIVALCVRTGADWTEG